MGDRRAPLFRPTVEIVFYPEDEVFKALTKAMRQSARTYELFTLARLFLEKPERLVAVIRPRPDSRETLLHISVPDGLPFETEDEAISHVLERHLDTFFTTEAVEVDPPKGSFPCVMKCGYTGELLGPPNYHRYQIILQEHYAKKLSNRTSFEGFQRRLETLREPEAVQQWLDGMRQVTRYTLKGTGEGESKVFESLESAKFFLTTHGKSALVKTAPLVRLSGRLLEQLPAQTNIRRSVDALLEQQRRFPLDTANHLRGRLRKLAFSVYKRGAKGVSYVCAVRRKFRAPEQKFSSSLEAVIQFVERNPGVSAAVLPHEILGLDLEAVTAFQEETAKAAAARAQAPAKAAAKTAVPPEVTSPEGIEAPEVLETPEAIEAPEASVEAAADTVTEDSVTAPEATAPVAEAPAVEVEVEASTEAEVAPVEAAPEAPAEDAVVEPSGPRLTGEEKLLLAQLRRDLRWLVSEGYVVEFDDATLFAPPARSPAEAAREQAEEESSESDSAPAEAATAEKVENEPVAEAPSEPVAEAPSEPVAEQSAPAPEPTAEPEAEAVTEPEPTDEAKKSEA